MMNVTGGHQSQKALHNYNYDVMAHSSDVISPVAIVLELVLVLLNVLPVIVVFVYKRRPRSRLAVDELIVALSLTEITGVLLPAPFGLTAYFSGSVDCKSSVDMESIISFHNKYDNCTVGLAYFHLEDQCLRMHLKSN